MLSPLYIYIYLNNVLKCFWSTNGNSFVLKYFQTRKAILENKIVLLVNVSFNHDWSTTQKESGSANGKKVKEKLCKSNCEGNLSSTQSNYESQSLSDQFEMKEEVFTLPWRDITSLLHESCQCEPETVENAEIIGHTRVWNVSCSLWYVRMLHTWISSASHHWITSSRQSQHSPLVRWKSIQWNYIVTRYLSCKVFGTHILLKKCNWMKIALHLCSIQSLN